MWIINSLEVYTQSGILILICNIAIASEDDVSQALDSCHYQTDSRMINALHWASPILIFVLLTEKISIADYARISCSADHDVVEC